MRPFFSYLLLGEPERVFLQRYRKSVEPESFEGARGAFEHRPDSVTGWECSLDPADRAVGYYGAGSAERLDIIARVLKEELCYGRRLGLPLPRGVDGPTGHVSLIGSFRVR